MGYIITEMSEISKVDSSLPLSVQLELILSGTSHPQTPLFPNHLRNSEPMLFTDNSKTYSNGLRPHCNFANENTLVTV
ncbi:UNVERIFIED_ORG: hypothetical protein J2Y78_004846 [Buttiauxella agrestis ATCC 33320]